MLRCLISIYILLYACTEFPNDVKQALYFSVNNQHELEKLLDNYSDDSLKYLAAEYLIKSMPYYSVQEVIPVLEMVFDSLALVPTGSDALRKSIYINLLDSVSGKGKKWPDETKYDIRSEERRVGK